MGHKPLPKLGLILSRFWQSLKDRTFVRSAALASLGSEQTFAAPRADQLKGLGNRSPITSEHAFVKSF